MHLYKLGAQHHLNETLLDGPIGGRFEESNGLLVPSSSSASSVSASVTTIFRLDDLDMGERVDMGGFFTMNGEQF
jgi:hypothetical protein